MSLLEKGIGRNKSQIQRVFAFTGNEDLLQSVIVRRVLGWWEALTISANLVEFGTEHARVYWILSKRKIVINAKSYSFVLRSPLYLGEERNVDDKMVV